MWWLIIIYYGFGGIKLRTMGVQRYILLIIGGGGCGEDNGIWDKILLNMV